MSERVGETSATFEEEITPSLVRRFAEAVGFQEVELVPPTFPTRWRHGEFELFQRFGIPLQRILHGEQAYSYHAPIRPGTRVSYRTRLKDATVRRGRRVSLNFLTFETEVFVNVAGMPKVATSQTTIVVKGEI